MLRKALSFLAVAVAAVTLAGCMQGGLGYAEERERVPMTYAERAMMPAPGPVVAYDGDHGMRRGEPTCKRDPDAVYKGHGTCVRHDTDRAEIQQIMPDVEGDHKCVGNAGYYVTVHGPNGAVGVMWRNCTYHR